MRGLLRDVVIGLVIVAGLLFVLISRPQQRAWYAENARVMASFETPGPRGCAAQLVTGGHFMGGSALAILVDAYEPGSRFRTGDEVIERVAVDVTDPVYDEPIAVARPRVQLYYTRSGPPGPPRTCNGAYADSGTGTIRLHREPKGRLRVELKMSLVPEAMPVPGMRELPPPPPPGLVRVRRTVTAEPVAALAP